MRRGLAIGALGGVVLIASGAMLASPGQAGQDRPGQIGQAKVWVENRGRNEAVPVILQEVMTLTPIGVQVIGTPTVTIAPATTVQARLVRQQWAQNRHEHRAEWIDGKPASQERLSRVWFPCPGRAPVPFAMVLRLPHHKS